MTQPLPLAPWIANYLRVSGPLLEEFRASLKRTPSGYDPGRWIFLDSCVSPPPNADEAWNLENWGTKYGEEETIVYMKDGELRIEFLTFETPPLAALKTLMNKWPTLSFTHDCA